MVDPRLPLLILLLADWIHSPASIAFHLFQPVSEELKDLLNRADFVLIFLMTFLISASLGWDSLSPWPGWHSVQLFACGLCCGFNMWWGATHEEVKIGNEERTGLVSEHVGDKKRSVITSPVKRDGVRRLRFFLSTVAISAALAPMISVILSEDLLSHQISAQPIALEKLFSHICHSPSGGPEWSDAFPDQPITQPELCHTSAARLALDVGPSLWARLACGSYILGGSLWVSHFPESMFPRQFDSGFNSSALLHCAVGFSHFCHFQFVFCFILPHYLLGP